MDASTRAEFCEDMLFRAQYPCPPASISAGMKARIPGPQWNETFQLKSTNGAAQLAVIKSVLGVSGGELSEHVCLGGGGTGVLWGSGLGRT